MMMPAASLRALLSRTIDYAGLFPPANLSLEQSLRNHAQYVRDPDVWMLGAFILPVAEFDVASPWLNEFDREHPVRISALGPRTENSGGFLDSLSGAQSAIDAFQSRFAGMASIEQLEMPLPPDASADVLASSCDALKHTNVKVFWEAPAKLARRAIGLIAENNKTNQGRGFGFKLRTGGVTAEAFPSSDSLAAVLFAAVNDAVPIKFTAGLHHPVRIFHESVQTKMHGFLNVLGAGVLARAYRWSESQITKMLDDEDPASFRFTGDAFAWREWKISPEEIAKFRDSICSFGSCSFDEPREDLRALNLL